MQKRSRDRRVSTNLFSLQSVLHAFLTLHASTMGAKAKRDRKNGGDERSLGDRMKKDRTERNITGRNRIDGLGSGSDISTEMRINRANG